jgi:hypothetical protein
MMSKSPRDLPQGWPTSIYRRPQHEIVVRHLTLLLSGWPDAQVKTTWRGHSVRSCRAAPLDRCHVYTFKPEPHDRQWSRDEVTRADKWPDTPIRTDRTRTRLLINAHSRCWAPWPDALAWRTRRTTTWHSVEYRELPERVFVDRTRPNITDRMHHSVRLSSRASLLHWVLTSHRPDASVPWPTGHAGARPASTRGMNWPNVTLASGRLDHHVRSLRKYRPPPLHAGEREGPKPISTA